MSRRGGRNRRRRGDPKKDRQQNQQQRAKAVFDPAKHFMPAPVPTREYPPCALSGEPLKNIYTAIAHPESGQPANFDRVLQELGENESLNENETICYLGSGSFGILVDQKGKKPRYFVRKRVQYEDDNRPIDWRRELSPGISRDYVPTPQPLYELHDEAEKIVGDNGYGRAPSSIYLPRND